LAPMYRSGTLVARWLGSTALFVLVVAALGLPPQLLAIEGVALLFALAGEWVQWRGHGRRLVRIGVGELLVVAVSVVMLGGVGAWVLVRPNPVFAIPSGVYAIEACPASTTVPDQGNEVNSSTAGSTADMTVGSKVYVTDSPTGASALESLSLLGTNVVCAAGGSGFGEVVIGVAPGDATLYVRSTDGVTYRISLYVG
jgi:hypothetical protein